MGYYTTFKLSFDEKSPEGTEVIHFLEFASIKNKPFTELRKTIKNLDEHFAKMEALEQKLSKGGASEYVNPEFMYDVWTGRCDSMKWYENEDDMKAFSKLFPKVVFTLSGEGEESGDVWSKYFKNGKMQVARATIIVEPFDAAKLK